MPTDPCLATGAPRTRLPCARPLSARLPAYWPLAAAILATQLLAAGQAVAQIVPHDDTAGGTTSVTVATTRDPIDKSYRKMIAGMDRFERLHALAPQATLRFQLLPRLPTTALDGITLRVAGDSVSLPVTVAPDHTFTLDRDDRALAQDAALIASRKTSTLTWRAQVRSPGVPAGMRRLGDLRLECQVGVQAGLLSNNARVFAWLGELFTDPDRVCGAPDGNYLFFADRPVFGVTVQHGERREALPFNMLYAGGTQTSDTLPFCDCQVLLDRSFYAPIWDARWPDDTLLAFDYIDDAPSATTTTTLAPGYGNTSAVRAQLGAATEVKFDNGMQVWRYRYPQARPTGSTSSTGQPQWAEFVILFDANGTARKARLTDPL